MYQTKEEPKEEEEEEEGFLDKKRLFKREENS